MFAVSRVSPKVNILNFRTKGLGSRRVLLFMEHDDRTKKVTSFAQYIYVSIKTVHDLCQHFRSLVGGYCWSELLFELMKSYRAVCI